MPTTSAHDTVVIDGYIDLFIDGGNCDLSVISESAEFGVFTALHDYTYPIYTGEIIVTPHAYEQTLDTSEKTVMSDITVLEIPYTEVSNPSGGYTVSIG